MLLEFIKFIILSSTIVIISKILLAPTIRSLAEELKLKSKTIGEISGYATSMPELLTVIASSLNGLPTTSIYNILSSNVINFIEYLVSIINNKNYKYLKNKGIISNLILVLTTILIPLILIIFKINLDIKMVIIFILLFIIFHMYTNKIHESYLQKEDSLIEKQITKEAIKDRKIRKKAIIYILTLLVIGVSLFLIGNALGNSIELLCKTFNVPELIIGILLGFLTSVPELMTFIESQKHHQHTNKILGIVESTNNLLTSNMLNLFIIESIATILYLLIL